MPNHNDPFGLFGPFGPFGREEKKEAAERNVHVTITRKGIVTDMDLEYVFLIGVKSTAGPYLDVSNACIGEATPQTLAELYTGIVKKIMPEYKERLIREAPLPLRPMMKMFLETIEPHTVEE